MAKSGAKKSKTLKPVGTNPQAGIRPENEEKSLLDASGNLKTYEEAFELALQNVCDSMSAKELAVLYLDTCADEDLLQWATDSNGNFSEGD